MSPTKEIRHYTISDAVLLSKARSSANEYRNYVTKFAAFDGTIFIPTFQDDFNAKIKVAESIPTDDVLIDEQAKEGEDVQKCLDKCLEEVRNTQYFVKKIAVEDPRILDQFGYNNLTKARKSVDHMVLFMDDFARKVDEYQEPLEEHGYSADKVDSVAILARNLKNERHEHIESKNQRKRKTDKRIQVFNTVWSEMVALAEAAPFALSDDAVGQDIFKLPRHINYGSKDEQTDESNA